MPPQSPTLERRFVSAAARPVQLRAATGEEGAPVIAGYAAVFYREGDPSTEFVIEFWGMKIIERIVPTAFNRAIAEDDVRCLMNHSADNLLGRNKAGTLRLKVDDVGLAYECDPPASPVGQTAVEAIRRGDMSGSSFQFKVTQEMISEIGADTYLREIHEVSLFDVAPVTFPAYEGTSVGVRSREDLGQVAEWIRANIPSAARSPASALSTAVQVRERELQLAELDIPVSER